ncbi:MAG TPA: hypothetical protein EYP19_12820 [Desulfobacterales bacterium]|nr:hypothetical protein [Desulfobacterales bacterium]
MRRGITVEDILNRPELILGIAGVLAVIGSLGTWASWGPVSESGFDLVMGKMTVVAGLIMLYSAAVRLGYVTFLEEAVPVFSVSIVCGLLVLIGTVAAWDEITGASWGLYLTVIASLVALFAACKSYTQPGARSGRRGP